MSSRGWEHVKEADIAAKVSRGSVRATRMPQVTRSKYGAVKTEVDGVRFASKAEAKRYGELLLLGQAGSIRNLELQPRFELYAANLHRYPVEDLAIRRVGTYVADFRYEELTETGGRWDDVIEDVKGVKTPVYRLKKKLVEAQYGIEIREV